MAIYLHVTKNLNQTVEIVWNLVGKGRIKKVTWKCLATSSGQSRMVEIYRQPLKDDLRVEYSRYSEADAPTWVPRPPEGWLDSLKVLSAGRLP